jgi:hypothetical protein
MQNGPAPRRVTRVNLGLRTNATWAQCEAAMNGTAAKRIAVVDSRDSDAWYPTNQSELAQAVRTAATSTGNWPTIIGVTY